MLPTVSSETPEPAPHRRRERWALSLMLVALLTSCAMLVHARHARARRALGPDATSAWARALPSPSLVLSTRSRWLRHPMLSEPGAAFQDGPAFLDADPAGALQSPPKDLLRTETAP